MNRMPVIRATIVILLLVYIGASVYTNVYIPLSPMALQREITLLRLETQQNRQEIDAMKRTQAWMQDEIFYLRRKK